MTQATKQQYQAYAAATQTVAGTRQVVMLYDGIIRYLQQAKEAMQDRRIEERYHLLTRASAIVFGLQNALDFEKGGDIATVLHDFYSSIDMRILTLHRSNSIELCDALIAELRQMREAWQEIDGKGGTSATSALPPESEMPPMMQQGAPPTGEPGVTLSA